MPIDRVSVIAMAILVLGLMGWRLVRLTKALRDGYREGLRRRRAGLGPTGEFRWWTVPLNVGAVVVPTIVVVFAVARMQILPAGLAYGVVAGLGILYVVNVGAWTIVGVQRRRQRPGGSAGRGQA